MAKRTADTYRSARREAWKALPRADRASWAEYNGSTNEPGIMSPVGSNWHNRYHLTAGKKERARHAGRPDGAMHGPLPLHERNTQAALFDMPKARKPRAARVAS